MVDLLNFSFWNDEQNPYFITIDGIPYTGYWALPAAIHRSKLENQTRGFRLTDPKWYGRATRHELLYALNMDRGEIPMLEERITLLQEAGKVICACWDGSIINLVKAANANVPQLIELMLTSFHSFLDCAIYRGRPGMAMHGLIGFGGILSLDLQSFG
jgi:hypothetical protein